jgi:hypothetical protein
MRGSSCLGRRQWRRFSRKVAKVNTRLHGSEGENPRGGVMIKLPTRRGAPAPRRCGVGRRLSGMGRARGRCLRTGGRGSAPSAEQGWCLEGPLQPQLPHGPGASGQRRCAASVATAPLLLLLLLLLLLRRRPIPLRHAQWPVPSRPKSNTIFTCAAEGGPACRGARGRRGPGRQGLGRHVSVDEPQPSQRRCMQARCCCRPH